MSRREYECAMCGEAHAYAWQATICCDVAAYGDEEP